MVGYLLPIKERKKERNSLVILFHGYVRLETWHMYLVWLHCMQVLTNLISFFHSKGVLLALWLIGMESMLIGGISKLFSDCCPKRGGNNELQPYRHSNWAPCVCMYFLTIGVWDSTTSKFHRSNMLKWEK